ncbi:MAG: hypothetical protein RIK87_08785 [Fuerstiella sp.]
MSSEPEIQTPDCSPIDDGGTSSFMCPGESSPVNRAIHLGRLASGWPGCFDCAWRHDGPDSADSPAPLDGASEKATGRIPDRAADRHCIRRSEFGVRGMYLNAIDRFRASQLASILSTHLTSLHVRAYESLALDQDAEDSATVRPAARATIAVGFGGRHGAPDIFAGVISAVVQNGCDVVDAGRSTAGSLLHLCRTRQTIQGALLVTGSGCGSARIGIDVFLADGQAVAVPWQDFGVAVRLPHQPNRETTDTLLPDSAQMLLNRIRGLAPEEKSSDPFGFDGSEDPMLILPTAQRPGGASFRANRRSGAITGVDSEVAYRRWLLKWWSERQDRSAAFLVAEDLVAERLEWLASELCLNLQIRRVSESRVMAIRAGQAADEPVPRTLTFLIGEDDRFLTVWTQHGRRAGAREVAAWINGASRRTAAHLTAHAHRRDDEIVLVDAASPETGHQHEVISDGLVTAGLLLSLPPVANT